MQSKFIKQNNSKDLIIFFNGWSVDEKIVSNLASASYDILMFYDYSDLQIEHNLLEKINNYQEINVISWSFGVWACGSVIDKFKNLQNVIAVNGTLKPVDKNFGIPGRMFDFTLKTLSEPNYIKFFENMFEGDPDISKFPDREIENQRYELEAIKHFSSQNNIEKNIEFFSKIYISSNDKIIPTKNQIAFWNGLNVKMIDSGHYCFDKFKTWDEIING